MADDAAQIRRLTTIVALDVANYSARTEADEARTTAEITALRSVIESIASRHGGRVFNTAGDGFMLEFASSLVAVEAAFQLAATCEPKVRVGVHLGDVMVQANGDLLGHGVNVAARLMAQAAPGSVLISGDVKRMMRGPLVESLHSRGTIKLAKMSETIEVFTFLPHAPPRRNVRARVLYRWARIQSRISRRAALVAGALAVALVAVVATLTVPLLLPQSDAPIASIAVLPFENLSAAKDSAFFAEAIQEEILTRLAKIGSLKVISRTSTAHLSSRPDNLRELARQLGVANILAGSVQREGDAVRVNVKLIKAANDNHLWAEIYDRKLDNIFNVQSEIAVAVAASLNATVTAEEKKSIALHSTNVPAAYDAYLQGVSLLQQRAGSAKAVAAFKEATALDPNFALAWAYLARLHAQTYSRRQPTEEQKRLAREALDNAVRLQPSLPEVQLAQGFYAYNVDNDYPRAREQFEKVHAAWPNEIESFLALGSIARRQGRWEESRSYYERAVALDPLRPDLRSSLIGVLVSTRNLDAALRAVDDALLRWPNNIRFVAEKARVLQRLGRLDESAALLNPLRTSTESFVYRRIASQATLERRYADAIPVLEAQFAQKPDDTAAGSLRLDLGRLRLLGGDAKGAADELEKARVHFEAELAREPKNASVANNLALVHCYLGDREKALDYVQKAMALSMSGEQRYDDTQMRIWAHFGERERAITALQRLQKMPSGSYTPALLRLDPSFDKLRSDPRFQALASEDAKLN